MTYNNANGVNFGNIVLLDNVRGRHLARSNGFWSYYLVAYIVKEPNAECNFSFGLACCGPSDIVKGQIYCKANGRCC